MKLTKKAVYALLLTAYVTRVGRTNLYTAAKELTIDLHFLEQIARKLRMAGILKSIRGPGGGYEIGTVVLSGEVLAAVGATALVTPETLLQMSSTTDGIKVQKIINAMQVGLNSGMTTSFATPSAIVL